MEPSCFSLAIALQSSSWSCFLLLLSQIPILHHLLLLPPLFICFRSDFENYSDLCNQIEREREREMAQSCLKIVRINNLRSRVNRRILILRRFTRLLWSRIVACTPGKSRRYLLLSRALPSPTVSRPQPPPIPAVDVVVGGGGGGGEFVRHAPVYDHDNSHRRSDSDLVSLKISLLGDPEIGKTSFLVRLQHRIKINFTALSISI